MFVLGQNWKNQIFEIEWGEMRRSQSQTSISSGSRPPTPFGLFQPEFSGRTTPEEEKDGIY